MPDSISPESLRERFKEHGQLGGFGFIDMEHGEEIKDVCACLKNTSVCRSLCFDCMLGRASAWT